MGIVIRTRVPISVISRIMEFLYVYYESLEDLETWQIIVGTICVIQSLNYLIPTTKKILKTNWPAMIFRLVRKLPIVKDKIDQELDKTVSEMEEEISKQIGNRDYTKTLPLDGWSREKILNEIDDLIDLGEFKAENGALSGTCHKQPDQEKVDTATAAY